jgi:hypothetical protein
MDKMQLRLDLLRLIHNPNWPLDQVLATVDRYEDHILREPSAKADNPQGPEKKRPNK